MIRPPLEVLTFDLDDTLWSVDDVLAAAEQTLHDWLHEHYPVAAARFGPTQIRALRRELAERQPALTRNASTLRRATMREMAHRCGLVEAEAERFVDQTFEVFLEARQARVAPYPEVLPALQRLARRFRIGVITNGNADIYRTPLAPYIDFAVRGVDLDLPKPEPAIFTYACRRAGAEPAQVLHVGDDPWVDAAGALEAGLQAALLCRQPEPEPVAGQASGCLVVPDMTALCHALEQALGEEWPEDR